MHRLNHSRGRIASPCLDKLPTPGALALKIQLLENYRLKAGRKP